MVQGRWVPGCVWGCRRMRCSRGAGLDAPSPGWVWAGMWRLVTGGLKGCVGKGLLGNCARTNARGPAPLADVRLLHPSASCWLCAHWLCSADTLYFRTAGKYGAFLGPDDSHFAVVEPTGHVAAVFLTAATTSATSVPLFTINMDGCSMAGGAVSYPLFMGPPCSVVSRSLEMSGKGMPHQQS